MWIRVSVYYVWQHKGKVYQAKWIMRLAPLVSMMDDDDDDR